MSAVRTRNSQNKASGKGNKKAVIKKGSKECVHLLLPMISAYYLWFRSAIEMAIISSDSDNDILQ